MLFCSFCGADQAKSVRLISGSGVVICEICVQTCSEILKTYPAEQPLDFEKKKETLVGAGSSVIIGLELSDVHGDATLPVVELSVANDGMLYRIPVSFLEHLQHLLAGAVESGDMTEDRARQLNERAVRLGLPPAQKVADVMGVSHPELTASSLFLAVATLGSV